MTCSRVIILHKGKIEASDTPANLLTQLRTAGNIRVEASTGTDNGLEQLQAIAGVKEVTLEPEGGPGTYGAADTKNGYRGFLLRVEAGSDPRDEIFRLAVARKWTLRELARRRATLEDVFVEITHAE